MGNTRLRGRPRTFTDKEKRCGRCKAWLPHDQFGKNVHSISGLDSYCRECKSTVNETGRKKYPATPISPEKKRAYHLHELYGITAEQYEARWNQQGRACGICEQPIELYARTTHVDHDHITGAVRGLLCHRCNWALGVFQDDIEGVEKALNYLKNSIRKSLVG